MQKLSICHGGRPPVLHAGRDLRAWRLHDLDGRSPSPSRPIRPSPRSRLPGQAARRRTPRPSTAPTWSGSARICATPPAVVPPARAERARLCVHRNANPARTVASSRTDGALLRGEFANPPAQTSARKRRQCSADGNSMAEQATFMPSGLTLGADATSARGLNPPAGDDARASFNGDGAAHVRQHRKWLGGAEPAAQRRRRTRRAVDPLRTSLVPHHRGSRSRRRARGALRSSRSSLP